ncbi:DEK domain-containing chromatin-associated protein 3-like [Rhododendron vialii]|uniref:DEK domain-containing chromatin-associated protein 3-like n=1 Tax=Rhododendron vialii TaxID=182163 RepID=UPI0026602F38|nr:DEK domain-containing chromatin-associated protein 3-like [Rhododendron vialii]XP_058218910.1 DEK domain-containing chromatin-associated protein 3-like [Rhododendron vialii]XP_058218911.1 DEK domain-containing chromatin-associated protein 3-like [Rhododendron vialii]XP_058218912.1 DEK domain-containing chromatin-associated protein 3-like [Rhododendron vialii]XP_058218913.1 DEK domain-containing chromatin-associated protein 3-like [Rhododendron vialii]XP_058218914.1 DEK domain-containing chr
MGEEETMSEVAEAAPDGNITAEHKVEDVPQTKEEHVKEMEEDRNDEKAGTQKMDVDEVGEENKETEEEEKKEEKQSKGEEEETKEDTRSDDMEEEMKAKENEENEEKGEEKVDELKEEEERDGESKQEKVSKGRGKGRTPGIKAKSIKKEVEEEQQKTPVTSPTNRPVRARKSVERLVESFEMESVKEFLIEKGRGAALRDIPNVAFKLSKRKTDETLKLLHTILFGRRGKAAQVKSNIFQFSGFVSTEDEEKQKIKMKEKLDKCVKEKLLGFCDVLDIPIAKADTVKTNTRKEDIIAKLIDFLAAPQATTTELLSEKEQSGKGTKRKRAGKQSAGSTPSKGSAKKSKMTEKVSKEGEKNTSPETGGESEEGEEEEKLEENGVHELSKNEVPDHSYSEENKDEFEDEPEQEIKGKRGSKKLSAKKEHAGTAKTKKVATPKKSSPPTERTSLKSSSKRSEVDDKSDASPKTSGKKRTDKKTKTKEVEISKKSSPPPKIAKSSSKLSEVDDRSDAKSPKTFSRKKKTEVVKEKSSAPKKTSSMEKTGKKAAKGKDKPKGDKLRPSDDELRNAICDILKEVDFNTATFTDILKLLAGRYNKDLTPRKSSIKLMIQNELTKLADEEDDSEEDD